MTNGASEDVTPGGFLPPEMDADSAEFWRHLHDGELWLPRCEANGHRFFPPAPRCPVCGTTPVSGEVVSGRGAAYSWVVIEIALSSEFADDVPYSVVAVDLAEGGRMLARYLGDANDLDAGDALRFCAYEVAGQVLPGFVRDDGAR